MSLYDEQEIVRDAFRQLLLKEFGFTLFHMQLPNLEPRHIIIFRKTKEYGSVVMWFSPEEWVVLLALAEAHPDCCPSEKLLARSTPEVVDSLRRKVDLIYRPIKVVPCELGYRLTNET